MSDQHDSGHLFTGPDPAAAPDEIEPPLLDPAPPPRSRRRRRERRSRLVGYLAVILAFAVVGVVGYVGVTRGIDSIKDRFAGPEDYTGAGTGSVIFEVRPGESVTTIGQNLKSAKVVASVEAFTDAVSASPGTVQIGTFPLLEQMPAADVVAVLTDSGNRLSSLTLVPGKTVKEIVALLARDTDPSKKDYRKALKSPQKLGLPAEANGDPEGYLFPGQYAIRPDDTAQTILKAMVDRYKEAAKEVDLAGAAERLGYTEHQLLTVASLVQAEVPAKDMAKVARVVYNRLEIEPNPSAGFLQIDAAVNYALGRGPITRLTIADIDSVADSPYNTYRQKGLPPGPIEAPGTDALKAAANPADGPWFFYVTVNLAKQQTKFTDDYDEFLRFSAELDDYCATQSDRC